MYFNYPDVHIAACKGGSMTETLFDEYLDEVFKKRPGALFSPSTLLLMDHATSHKVSIDYFLKAVFTITSLKSMKDRATYID